MGGKAHESKGLYRHFKLYQPVENSVNEMDNKSHGTGLRLTFAVGFLSNKRCIMPRENTVTNVR